jgi:hypothetical protein
MTEHRMLHTATVMQDGRVLLAGGRYCFSDCEGSRSLGDAEIYDPTTGVFTATGEMSVPREGLVATALPDGRVFLYGGLNTNGHGGSQFLTSSELFQPASGSFTPASSGSVAGVSLIAVKMHLCRLPVPTLAKSGGLIW